MNFRVGCDWHAFQAYYKTLDDWHSYRQERQIDEAEYGEIGECEAAIVREDPQHLIVWLVDQTIVGHTIWHETSTDEYRPGDSRTQEERSILREYFGRSRGDLVELHEVWLKTSYRGNGYGTQFFDFFEGYIQRRGTFGIIYYTDHPAAKALCRRRGYSEWYQNEEGWILFCLQF